MKKLLFTILTAFLLCTTVAAMQKFGDSNFAL